MFTSRYCRALKKGRFIRHPREGGDSVYRKTPEKQVNFRALSASRVVFFWIPAFEGMTGLMENLG
jgi:hypothetical protein